MVSFSSWRRAHNLTEINSVEACSRECRINTIPLKRPGRLGRWLRVDKISCHTINRQLYRLTANSIIFSHVKQGPVSTDLRSSLACHRLSDLMTDWHLAWHWIMLVHKASCGPRTSFTLSGSNDLLPWNGPMSAEIFWRHSSVWRLKRLFRRPKKTLWRHYAKNWPVYVTAYEVKPLKWLSSTSIWAWCKGSEADMKSLFLKALLTSQAKRGLWYRLTVHICSLLKNHMLRNKHIMYN